MLEFYLEGVGSGSLLLSHPKQFSLVCGQDSPADSLKAVFPLEQEPGQLSVVRVTDGGQELFSGQVDTQEMVLDEAGSRLEISARSRGALLLDNEACPREYFGVTLEQVFGDYLSPLGFVNRVGQSGYLDQYTVSRGSSRWEAFAGLCLLLTGKEPWVSGGNQVVLKAPEAQAWTIPAAQVVSRRHSWDRYHPLSRVYVRNEDGLYYTWEDSAQAQDGQIFRERYAVPAPQWARQPEADARRKLEESWQGQESWEWVISGLMAIRPGDQVLLDSGHWGEVRESELRFGGGGAFTRVLLW